MPGREHVDGVGGHGKRVGEPRRHEIGAGHRRAHQRAHDQHVDILVRGFQRVGHPQLERACAPARQVVDGLARHEAGKQLTDAAPHQDCMDQDGGDAARHHEHEQEIDLGRGAANQADQEIEDRRNHQQQVAEAVAEPDAGRGAHHMGCRHHDRQHNHIEGDRERQHRRVAYSEPDVEGDSDDHAAGEAGQRAEDQGALEQALLVGGGILAPEPHHQHLLAEGRDDAEQAGGAEQDRIGTKTVLAERAGSQPDQSEIQPGDGDPQHENPGHPEHGRVGTKFIQLADDGADVHGFRVPVSELLSAAAVRIF